MPASAQTPVAPRNTPSDLPNRKAEHVFRAIDQVGVEERTAKFQRRSIKRESKRWALELAVRTTDLTTLEGADTPGKVRALCAKAMRPDPACDEVPPVAAVCVYPNFVAVAKKELADSGVRVASVATGFPAGQVPLAAKLNDVAAAVAAGADEIDMVIDRGALLRGEDATVFDEIVRIRQACGDAHLKVILETGELGSYDNVRRASDIAMFAGADFIKTSTGKIGVAATLPVTLVMLEAIRDYHRATGIKVGMKPAGGIRHAKQAIHYLVMVNEVLGMDWLTPDLWRFGASSLLNDVLLQLGRLRTGVYQGADYYTLD